MNALDLNIMNEEMVDGDENLYPIENFKLTTTPNDFNISTIISFLDAGVFVIPDFQRNYVWDINKASKLIESLLIGLPIPQMFLYEKSRNKFYIIDGQQRLMSIYFFVKGRFPKTNARLKFKDNANTENHFLAPTFLADDDYFSDFKLKLDSKTNPHSNRFHNEKYITLALEDKTTLDLATIRNMVIKPSAENPNNVESMFEIFNRLNSGGMNLNYQEIRMSLYYSPFLQKLVEMNKEIIWRNKLGKSDPDLRLKDVEMILRLFSMLFSGYRPPIAKDNRLVEYQNTIIGFLNSTANIAKNFTVEEVNFLFDLWKAFLMKWENIQIPFNFSEDRKAAISVTFLESIFYAVCFDAYRSYKENQHNILDSLKLDDAYIEKIKQSTEFKEAATGKTTTKENMQNRLKIAYDIHRKHFYRQISSELSIHN